MTIEAEHMEEIIFEYGHWDYSKNGEKGNCQSYA